MRAWLITTGILTAALYYSVSVGWWGAEGFYPGADYWYGWFVVSNLLYLLMLVVAERQRFQMVAGRFQAIGREGIGMLLFVLSLTTTLIGVSSYGVAASIVYLSIGTVRREAACDGLCGLPGLV